MASAKPWLHPEHHSTFFETSSTGWTIDKFDKEWRLVILARKLEIPIERLQTKVELLQHENGGLKETYKMKQAMQKPSLRLSF